MVLRTGSLEEEGEAIGNKFQLVRPSGPLGRLLPFLDSTCCGMMDLSQIKGTRFLLLGLECRIEKTKKKEEAKKKKKKKKNEKGIS